MEAEQVMKFPLDYSEEFTISLIGTKSEFAGFLPPRERGDGQKGPITLFALDENGNRKEIPPQDKDRYYQQLRAIEEALSAIAVRTTPKNPSRRAYCSRPAWHPISTNSPAWAAIKHHQADTWSTATTCPASQIRG